ncbi:MAG: hypothetical protein ACL7BU_13480 [Candidatus Phlomobacter fragariae]
MLLNWDNIPGITERRGFALSLLRKAPSDIEIKPVDYKVLRDKDSTLITQLVKCGYRNEALDILSIFNTKKLGDVTDYNLTQLIEKAETVLTDNTSEGSNG